MSVGGIASVQYFQQSQKLSAQTAQLQHDKGSQTTESLINRSSTNTIRNQQNNISTLQNSVQRGQAMDMYV